MLRASVLWLHLKSLHEQLLLGMTEIFPWGGRQQKIPPKPQPSQTETTNPTSYHLYEPNVPPMKQTLHIRRPFLGTGILIMITEYWSLKEYICSGKRGSGPQSQCSNDKLNYLFVPFKHVPKIHAFFHIYSSSL